MLFVKEPSYLFSISIEIRNRNGLVARKLMFTHNKELLD